MRGTATDRAARGALLAVLPVLALHGAFVPLESSTTAQGLLSAVVQLACAGALVAGAVRHRPALRAPWLLLAASQACSALAGLTYLLSPRLPGVSAGAAAAGAVAHTLLVLAAAAVWTRRATSVRDPMAGIDVGIIAVVSAFLSWTYVMEPVLARADLEPGAVVVILAFPLVELITIGLIARLCLGAARATPALLLVVSSLLLWSSADGLLLLDLTHGTDPDSALGGPLRLLSVGALAAAGLHPTMAAPTGADRTTVPATSARRLVLLGLAIVLPPIVLLIQYARGEPLHALAVGVACILLSALVMARMAYLVTEQRALTITDALTGLHTRRFFDEVLDSGTGRTRPQPDDIGLLIVDVDHFKQVNDGYGHPAGDRVLREIATRLRDATRAGDVVARYGGEEFAVLLPRTTHAELGAIAERIRAAVAATPIDVGDDALTVTVSIGVAAVSEGLATSDELAAAADRRLYAAKAAGRNRVAC